MAEAETSKEAPEASEPTLADNDAKSVKLEDPESSKHSQAATESQTQNQGAKKSSSASPPPETDPAAAPSKGKKKKGHKHTQSTQIPFIPAASSKPVAEGDEEEDDRIRLGICAMDKKARSKPMAEILSRLDEEVFHVVFFGDDVILKKPVEEWPICHVLIAFYSKGYPLDKALEYVELRKPFTLNDLPNQKKLMDRRMVYDLLEGSGIDVPRVSLDQNHRQQLTGQRSFFILTRKRTLRHSTYT